MVIEFAGLSCAGKSTVMRRLARLLAEEGTEVRQVSGWRTTRAEVLAGFRDPRLLAWYLLNLRRVRARTRRQVLGAVAVARTLNRMEGLTLLDEGPVKLSERPSLNGSRGRALLARSLPGPDLLVLVTCDPEVRLERLRREDRRHARARSDREILADQTGVHAARRFAAATGVPLVEIDTSAAEDPLPRLRQLLTPYLRLASEPRTGAMARLGRAAVLAAALLQTASSALAPLPA